MGSPAGLVYHHYFPNCEGMLYSLKYDLNHFSMKVGRTREIIGTYFILEKWEDRDEVVTNLPFCKAEFYERAGTDLNPGYAWQKDKDRLKKYIDKETGKFPYTYGERMSMSLHRVMENLRETRGSRREFLSIWNEDKDSYERDWEKKRKEHIWIPCSIGYHFLKRKGILEMVYIMRSCNIEWLATDIWLATKLLEYVAEYAHVKPGPLKVFISSLHQFKGGKK